MRRTELSAAYLLVVLLILAAVLPLRAGAVNEALIHRPPDGSRADAVHRIPLLDANGEKISPEDKLVLPFSTRSTCGDCHDYQAIRGGWHFSASSTDTLAGRPAEPWILTDEWTGTQLPVSGRGWKGTWRPADIGLTPWGFVKAFGSHLPGGDMGEMDEETSTPSTSSTPSGRWLQSGKLEIDCLACHNGSPRQDQSEWAAQIEKDNFQWAATAASGLANVRGAVALLPETYDIYSGPMPDEPAIAPPSVEFNPGSFEKDGKVFFDVRAKPTANRCAFCHSTQIVDERKWETDEDVHLAAGLTCVDCHRNGIDHKIVRGYGAEGAERGTPCVATLSCEGCHLGADDDATTVSTPQTGKFLPHEKLAGRLGAPRPLHKGLPIVHFEKMACTSCHSGAWPMSETRQARTSRANKLGIHTGGEQSLPTIASPVFMRQADGKIAPHNVVWPAFWARLSGDTVRPMLPQEVASAVGAILGGRDSDTTGTEKILTEGKIARALAALRAGPETEATSGATVQAARKTGGNDLGEPVYVSGGRMFRLDADGKLAASDHPSARPYAWPIAHDVRPAGRSLGVRACEDCHSSGAPFYFGVVKPLGPLKAKGAPAASMADLMGKTGPIYMRTNRFFKWLIIITMALLVLHILGDLTRRALRRTSG